MPATRPFLSLLAALLAALWTTTAAASGGDLDAVLERGTLRHLGVPYANFVTGSLGGDEPGMDVELMQAFADHLGVGYAYVRTDWSSAIGQLTGRRVKYVDGAVEVLAEVPIEGDVIANGMTVIPWRGEVVAFADVTFPTQVWLVARADSLVQPIAPTGRPEEDIANTKAVLGGRTLLGKLDTCLDPSLYEMQKTGAKISLFDGTLNELAPAVISNESEMTLLDVPDALVALQKWPGRIKVIGPVSEEQTMAPAFRKDAPRLRAAFNAFLAEMKADGRFRALALRYYPFVSDYFPDFLGGK